MEMRDHDGPSVSFYADDWQPAESVYRPVTGLRALWHAWRAGQTLYVGPRPR